MRKAVVLNLCASVALLLVVRTVPATAAPILLHGTGEGLVQDQLDPFWTVELPDGTPFGQAISATDPNGGWVAPTPPNTWISVVGRSAIPAGVYRYSTTFMIDPGFDPATALISGHWWADEPSAANGIYLNGVQVSAFSGAIWFDTDPANALFSINSGFVAGLNVLTFDVENTAGPGGALIQDLEGSVLPVPEPGTLLLVTTALTAAGIRRRRMTRA